MARQVDYECMNCGYELSSVDEIFWIDDGLDIHIEPLLMTTSAISSEAPVKGYFTRYYCYDCRKFISKFVIFKNSNEISDENIITLIEQYDNSPKIIQFDDVFQKCLECGSDLASKADYSFVLDENDEFHIGESVIDFPESESNKFAGEYHGFFCSQCKKQINKFVITQNNANLTDEEIKAVSAITHGHEISMQACVIYIHVARRLLAGEDILDILPSLKYEHPFERL